MVVYIAKEMLLQLFFVKNIDQFLVHIDFILGVLGCSFLFQSI